MFKESCVSTPEAPLVAKTDNNRNDIKKSKIASKLKFSDTRKSLLDQLNEDIKMEFQKREMKRLEQAKKSEEIPLSEKEQPLQEEKIKKDVDVAVILEEMDRLEKVIKNASDQVAEAIVTSKPQEEECQPIKLECVLEEPDPITDSFVSIPITRIVTNSVSC